MILKESSYSLEYLTSFHRFLYRLDDATLLLTKSPEYSNIETVYALRRLIEKLREEGIPKGRVHP